MTFIPPRFRISVERWKYNKVFGIYASTLGNFRDGNKKALYIKISSKGYCLVWSEKLQKYVSAHRVVMMTWRPIDHAELMTVDHLNHNKRDNSLDNLEWVTQEENLNRANNDRAFDGPVDLTVGAIQAGVLALVSTKTGWVIHNLDEYKQRYNPNHSVKFNDIIRKVLKKGSYDGHGFVIKKVEEI